MLHTGNLMDMVRDHGLLKDLDPLYVGKLAALALEAYFQPDQIVFRADRLRLCVDGTGCACPRVC